MRATVYSRPGCHLCEEAIDALAGLLSEHPSLEIDEVDIEGDEDLHRLYLERIPVVMLEGKIVSELVFDVDRFRARLGP